MYRKELRISIILKVILKSKKNLSEIKSSVGPVSSTRKTLEKLESFLEEIEQEVERLPRKRISFTSLALLAPVVRLLQELWVKAIEVIGVLLGRN